MANNSIRSPQRTVGRLLLFGTVRVIMISSTSPGYNDVANSRDRALLLGDILTTSFNDLRLILFNALR